MQALGLIETRGLIAAVESADAMLKAAEVTLLEKTFVGGGLVSIVVTGDVAAVKAAVEAGSAAVKQINEALLVSKHVIPRPHEEINDLIVNTQNIQSVGVETTVEAETTEDDVISEEAEDTDTLAKDFEAADSPKEEIETSSPNISLDKINKESIDKLVLKSGLEKAIQVLSKLKVTKLRNLARKYGSMDIKGRTISKADKNMLLAKFKEYYT